MAHPHAQARQPAWRPVSRCSSRRPPRRGARTSTSGSRATSDTLLPRTAATTSTSGRSRKDGEPAAPVRRQQRGAAPSRRGDRAATGAASLGGRSATTRSQHDQGEAARTLPYNARALLVVLAQLQVRDRPARAATRDRRSGDDVLFFADCFGAGCDARPSPLRIDPAPASAAPAGRRRDGRRSTTVTSTRRNADDDASEPAAERDGDGRRPDRSRSGRGRQGDASPWTTQGRPACGRQGRLRALGDRAGVRRTAERVPGRAAGARRRRRPPTTRRRRRARRSATARCSRAGGRRGCCAAASPPTRRGCGRSSCG